MAKPRPPVIISNGKMLGRIADRGNQNPNHDKLIEILYGDEIDNGFVTIVTLVNNTKIVFWRALESDPKFKDADKTPYITDEYDASFWVVKHEKDLYFVILLAKTNCETFSWHEAQLASCPRISVALSGGNIPLGFTS